MRNECEKIKPAVDPKEIRDHFNMDDVIGHIPPLPEPKHLIRKFDDIGGKRHSWVEYVPEGLPEGERVPLVVFLHGGGQTGEKAAQSTMFTNIADQEKFIIVFPEATLKFEDEEGRHHEWNAFYINNKKEDETVWLAQFIEICFHEYPIDRSRIYLTGHSNGDSMALQLAISHTLLFAACAGLNGPTYIDNIVDISGQKIKPKAPLPYLRWNGERDPLGGQPNIITRPEVNVLLNRYWIENNQCVSEPCFRLDGKLSTEIYESDCEAEVRFTEYKNGPHGLNIEVAHVVWYEFFSRFSRGEDGTIIVSESEHAAPTDNDAVALVDGADNALVHGKVENLENSVCSINGILFAPIKVIGEWFGASVDEKFGKANVYDHDNTAKIIANHPALQVNNQIFEFAENPCMKDGTIYCQVQLIVEKLFNKKVSQHNGVMYISDRETEISRGIASTLTKLLNA